MIECVLFSDNSELKNRIGILLEKEDISLDKKTLSDLKDYKTSVFSVIVIDVGSKKDRDLIKTLTPLLLSYKNKKILLTKESQASDILFEIEGFEDFIFYKDIDDNLAYRVRFNYMNMDSIDKQNHIVIGELVLNLEKYELIVEGKVIVLTFKEFEMLKLLVQNKNKVFTRINLLSQVWGYDYYGGSRTVDVHMRRLRSKIPPPYNDMLKTVRNVGYMFSPPK